MICCNQSALLVLMVVGNDPGFLGTVKGVALVESTVYSITSRIIPMCPWLSLPFVVWAVASIAPNSCVSFVHVFVGRLAANLGDFEFLEAVLDVLFDAHGCSNMLLLHEKD